jgi:cell wall-associated NlpC family hydrolase
MLADGKFYGTPLTLVQRGLRRNGHGDVKAKGFFGSNTRRAIQAIQRKAGLQPTGNIGMRVWAVLDRQFLNDDESKRINTFVAQKREEQTKAAAIVRRKAAVERTVRAATVMIDNRDQIHYAGPGAPPRFIAKRMQGVRQGLRLPEFPRFEDCSSSVTWLYFQADAPDPNGRGYDGHGFTGTLVGRGKRIPLSKAAPGDLVFYGESSTRSHVVCVMAGAGAAARAFSHGVEEGPLYVNVGYRPVAEVRRYPLSRLRA